MSILEISALATVLVLAASVVSTYTKVIMKQKELDKRLEKAEQTLERVNALNGRLIRIETTITGLQEEFRRYINGKETR